MRRERERKKARSLDRRVTFWRGSRMCSLRKVGKKAEAMPMIKLNAIMQNMCTNKTGDRSIRPYAATGCLCNSFKNAMFSMRSRAHSEIKIDKKGFLKLIHIEFVRKWETLFKATLMMSGSNFGTCCFSLAKVSFYHRESVLPLPHEKDIVYSWHSYY